MFGLPTVDAFSFFLGAAFGAAVIFLLYRIRQPIRDIGSAIFGSFGGAGDGLISNAEKRLRNDVLKWAQSRHLGGALFALDDILVAPRLLAPTPTFDPASPPPIDDVNSIIPMVPEWPELAGIFSAPSILVEAALSGHRHLLVLGPAGSGKTTLLAHLASRAARGDPDLFPEDPTPILIHARDLSHQPPGEDGVVTLVRAAQLHVPGYKGGNAAQLLTGRLRQHTCLILVDGLDEVPEAKIAEVAAWIRLMLAQHGRHRIIAAAHLGHVPLLEAGLAPITIAPWNATRLQALIAKWGSAWNYHVRAQQREADGVDLLMLLGWLSTENAGQRPLQLTLKVWAAMAGDAHGKREVDWLRSYLLRHKISPAGERALGRLALAMLESEPEIGISRAEAITLLDAGLAGPSGKQHIDSQDYLDDLLTQRILVRYGTGLLTFEHRHVLSMCAAFALAADSETVTPGTSRAWIRTLRLLASLGDSTAIVRGRLKRQPDLLHTDLLALGTWLRDAPAAAPWRGDVLRRLSLLMRNADMPEGLRARALAGLVATRDASVNAFFKQGLKEPDPFTRRLSALGLGAMGDSSALLNVSSHFTDEYLEVRWAAVLALSAMNAPASAEALTQGLFVGDDRLRMACALALAHDEREGHDVLREAMEHSDVGLRRAAVLALATIEAQWVLPLLEAALPEEQEWLIQASLQEALDGFRDPARRAPTAPRPPEAHDWLIAWAAQESLGIVPGPTAYSLLLRTAREADESTQLASIELLGRLGQPGGLPELYTLLGHPSAQFREAAFRSLAQIAYATGQRLPALDASRS